MRTAGGRERARLHRAGGLGATALAVSTLVPAGGFAHALVYQLVEPVFISHPPLLTGAPLLHKLTLVSPPSTSTTCPVHAILAGGVAYTVPSGGHFLHTHGRFHAHCEGSAHFVESWRMRARGW